MAIKKENTTKTVKEKKEFIVSIRKLKANYELRYDFNKMLTEYIKTLPKEHRGVRVDSVIDVDGNEKSEWVRLIREVAMGQIISFFLDNNISFVFQNVPEEDIAKLRLDYLERQKRLALTLRLKAEQLVVDDTPFNFMKKQPYHYQKQAIKFFEINNGISILGDQPGVGKRQPISALIATPEGWCKMVDVKLGQKIFHHGGNSYPITGIYPQGIQNTYKVIFNDNFIAECDMEHLWLVRDVNRRKRGNGWVVKSLQELVDSGLCYNHSKKSERAKTNRKPVLKWEIPITQPVNYSTKKFIIDPYTLGALIGDGGLSNGSTMISIPDFQLQIKEEIDSNLLVGYKIKKKNVSPGWEHLCSQYSIIKNELNKSNNNLYTQEIKNIGLNILSGKKFIPKKYLYGDVNQRLSLLQGLMDTDGSALNNRINFHTTSKQLADDVSELVQSLGGQAIICIYDREKEGKGIEYRVNVRLKLCPFRLKGKIKHWRISKRNYPSRYIESVEFVRREEHQCIRVASPDNTYMTNHYIVTHNTLPAFAYAAKHQYKTLVICPASLKLNWRKEITDFTDEKAFIYKFKPKKKSKIKAHTKEESLFHIVNYESLETYLKIEYKHVCKGKKIVAGKGMETCGTEIVDLVKKHKECPICKNQNSFKSRIVGYKGFTDDFEQFIDPTEYDLIVIDEFHRIKEKKTGWTQIIKEAFRDVVPRKLLLSGTAIKSRPSEFFMGLNFLDPKSWNNQHEFGVRYCLHEDSPILMSDFTDKKIKDIKIGDKIIAWDINKKNKLCVRKLCEAEVKKVLIRKADLLKITLENGKEIICTENHKWLNGYSYGKNQSEYYTPKIGNNVVYIADAINQPEFTKTNKYKEGYLFGSFRGDGHCVRTEILKTYPFRKQEIKYIEGHKVGLGCKDIEFFERVKLYLDFVNLPYEHTKSKDGLYRLWINNKIGYDYFSREIIQEVDINFWRGFLSGMYDAEGSYNKISQSEYKNKINYDLIEHALKTIQINYTIHKNTFSITGGREGMLNFWRQTYPALNRKLKSFFFYKGGKFMTKKIKIKKIEEFSKNSDVYTLTTTTGNYIAYGCGSKNCAGFEDTFGWKYDGASNLEELYERMSPVFLRRLKKDVLKDLPPKTYTNIPIELTNEEYKDYNKLLDDCVKIIDGKEVKEGYLEKILKLKLFLAKCKLKRVVEFIQDIVDSGDKVVIMSDFQEIAEAIYEQFRDVAVLHTGSVNDVNKQEAVDRFQSDKKIKVFSGMIIASGVGITLTAAHKLMFMGFAWTSADMQQAEDRIHRASTTHDNVQIITPYVIDTIDEDIMQMLDEKEKILNKALDNKTGLDKNIQTSDLNILKSLIGKMSI